MGSAGQEWGRRKLLAGGMGSLLAALAGCLSDAGEQSTGSSTSAPEPRTGTRTQSPGETPDTQPASRTRTRTPSPERVSETHALPRTRTGTRPSATAPESQPPSRTPTPTDQPAASLRLPSVAAPGSPGGFVSLRPPEKVVLLDFFATWCAPCKPEMANLRAARKRFGREDVFIISITTETDQKAIKQFWTEYDGTWPVAMDPNLRATRKYQVRTIPTIIIFTTEGQKVMRHTGLAGENLIISKITQALKRS